MDDETGIGVVLSTDLALDVSYYDNGSHGSNGK